jgi:fucose 4-O-acetylase-like acetyltransferase
MSNTNSLNQSKPFLKYIGYMQAICIILVVAGHSLHMYPDGHHGASTLAYRLIYSFHMPAFLFISGFLFDYSSSKHIGKICGVIQLIKVKAERLLIPFFVLTAITFVPRALLSGIADDNIPLTWSAFMRAFFFDDSLVLVYFWFIQSLFLLSCIMSIFFII